MIFGFAFTASISGKFLTPFSFERLLMVSSTVSVIAVIVTFLAIWGMESPVAKTQKVISNTEEADFFAQFLSTKGGVLIAPVTSAQGASHLCLYTRKKSCTEQEDFLPVKFAGWVQCFVKLAVVTNVCLLGLSYVFLNLDSNI